MLRRSTVPTLLATLAAVSLALLLGLAATAPAGSAVAAPPAAASPVRVMPLGDSITGSPGCWRSTLWNRLQTTGYPNVDFVGTLGPQGCGQPYDGDNEGHGGYLATNVANQNLLPGWLSATRPDIVLMHFGTNDVWSNIAPATILAAYSKLVDQMRASNPTMRVIVAKIIPMAPPTCAECGQRVVALNTAIGGWAAGKTTAQSPIVVVDQWTGFNTAADTYDGVHPNASGDQKMSDRWYPALAAALANGGGTPTSTPTATPTASPTPTATPTQTPAPGASCTANYRIVGQWQGGFQGEVTIRNTGDVRTAGWTVGYTLAGGQRISQAWNAEVTQAGDAITARNVTWNGALAPGAEATFGFLGSATGTPTAPTVSCTAS
ncbi:cellulose binding domain-containing protein [Micromonospora sp. NPDC005189]|uniref:cellulose binding domain-containing protein n=1 Tax=Micromonospora sp. NPDC005189 TaxID=3157019 RepID=UPI0033B4CC35